MNRKIEYRKLISTARWHRMSATYKVLHPFCEECLKRGLYVPAAEVHHKHPVERGHSPKEMEQLCFSQSNLESVCASCHKELHRRLHSHLSKEEQREIVTTDVRDYLKKKFGLYENREV